MSKIVAAIIRIGSNILELLTIKERRKERKEHQDEIEAPTAAAEQAAEEVRAGDEDKVNERIQDIFRPRGGNHVGAVDWRVLGVVFLAALALLCGCVKTKIVRVPANQHVVHLTVEGQDGYFVPTDVMEAMMYRLTFYSYREDIEEARRDEP